MSVFLYASAQNDNRIRRFEVNVADGRLMRPHDIPVPGGPGPLGVDPSGTVLYVGHRGRAAEGTGGDGAPRPEFGLSSWAVDPRTSDLRRTGSVATAGEPCYVSTDRRGRYVLSAYYQAGACAVHPLDGARALGAEAVEWRETNSGAHSFQTDPSNRFAFVPHIADGSGGLARLPEGRRRGINTIVQFRFDEVNGTLTPNVPPTVGSREPHGPRHYVFHPSKPLVYVDNEQGSSVSVYRLDAERGVLGEVQTVSSLPEGYRGSNAPAQIHVDPGGRFLFCSNRGHDSIARFRIDPVDGRLTPAGWTEVRPRPRAFNLDPNGRYLYVTSQVEGTLAAFRVDPASGALAPIETYEVGAVPMWVLCVTRA
jgi:6-phosphogluconolactonase